MEGTENTSKSRENFKERLVSEKLNNNETLQINSSKHLQSPMQEKHVEASPLRRISPKLLNAPVQNSGLEDIREEDTDDKSIDSTHDPPPCSTFTVLPSHTTPPSRQNKILNPFEAALIKRLQHPIFSPSVFQNVVSPTQDRHHFYWTIEDVAKIRPAPIEENQLQQYEVAVDPETELKAQEAIDHYFCNTHIVSSPWGPQQSNENPELFVETNNDCSPEKHTTSINNIEIDEKVSVCEDFNRSYVKREVSTQTTLSLPPELPPALEAALKPYFIISQDQYEYAEEANLSTSTLRRKLFVHEEDHHNMLISPVRSPCFSMHLECKLNCPTHSGLLVASSSKVLCPSTSIIKNRTYGTPLPGSTVISSPEISPIGSLTAAQQRNKSVARLNFSSRLMAVDSSTERSPPLSPLGMVPIQHDDEQNGLKTRQWETEKNVMSFSASSSSAMIISQTSSPIKGETESFDSTSVMITSGTSTPIKEKLPSFIEDASMERINFKQIKAKFSESESTSTEEATSLNSFCLHSNVGNTLSCNLYSQDTGYQTGSLNCNMTSINNGASSSTFSSSSSKNWTDLHFKSLADKNVGVSNEGFFNEKFNPSNKASSVIVEDNSLWLPSSRHIISSTPTKTCN